MLALTGLDWEPVLVRFFDGETRSERYRTEVNEMGEVPVLEIGALRLSQSAVILEHLAEETGRFQGGGAVGRREVLRWLFWDNHKLTSYTATHRFLRHFQGQGDGPVVEFLKTRALSALAILEKHLEGRSFVVGGEPSIADLSLSSYLFYGEELFLPMADYPSIVGWLERIRAIPGWKGPYELMPGAFPPSGT